MLISVGHGRLDRTSFADLLRAADVGALVDIRRYPGSRNNPDVAADAMSEWLPAAGISYRSEPRLGGRRRLAADAVREDPWWQVEQFAAYAAHTRTGREVEHLMHDGRLVPHPVAAGARVRPDGTVAWDG